MTEQEFFKNAKIMGLKNARYTKANIRKVELWIKDTEMFIRISKGKS